MLAAVEKAFRRLSTSIHFISVPSVLARVSSECRFAHVSQTEICMCTLSMMEIPFRNYKCHRSNGVVFCFHKDRVFVTCMDDECRSALTNNRHAYYVMGRVIEEDICKPLDNPENSSTRRQGCSATRHEDKKTSIAKALLLDPCSMMQPNPALRKMHTPRPHHHASSEQAAAGAAGAHHDACTTTSRPGSMMYMLGSDHVKHVLSKGQIQWLQTIKAERDELIASREQTKLVEGGCNERVSASLGSSICTKAASVSAGGNDAAHHDRPCKRFKPSPQKQRFSIRSVCKVPWR